MNYKVRYKTEIENRLKQVNGNIPILKPDDIKHLPVLIQNYLYYSGAVNNPIVTNLRIVFSGKMKTSVNGSWRKITAMQFSFFKNPARLFYIHSSIFSIPFQGLHIYADNKATMEIKVASFITVVDAKGDEMNQSETVTFFNDMCLFAPSNLIDRKILWEKVDSKTVKAKYTNGQNTISAFLVFNEDGGLENFISNDRYLSSDGKTYSSYPWSTPVKEYRSIENRKVPVFAEAIWDVKGVPFTYAAFRLKEIEYNCRGYK